MRMKLVSYESMTSVMVSEQNWPQIELLSPFLWPLRNCLENSFCHQICGELKVPPFSKIIILTNVLIASVIIDIKWKLIPFSHTGRIKEIKNWLIFDHISAKKLSNTFLWDKLYVTEDFKIAVEPNIH